MKFFEDLVLGEVCALGTHTFTAEEIRGFARSFAPLPIHLDAAAAHQAGFDGVTASGWQVASVWMRHLVEFRARDTEVLRERNEPISENGVSPGFRKMRWLKPVYAGDTIAYTSTIANLRPSNSRPDWGLCEWHNSGVNQRGETVLSFYSTVFVQRRSALEKADRNPPTN